MAGKGKRQQEEAGIYKIVNIINGKTYYGSSIQLSTRISNHKVCLRNNNHENKYLQNAWNKYGEENFRFEIVEIIDVNNLSISESIKKVQSKEQEYLDLYHTYEVNKGYNIDKIASGGREKITWETIDALNTRISKDQIKKVIQLLQDECNSFNDIAKQTGVSKTMIINIFQHRTYQLLTENISFPKRRQKQGFCRVPYIEFVDGILNAYYDSMTCLCKEWGEDHKFFEKPRIIDSKKYTWKRYNLLTQEEQQLAQDVVHHIL